MLVLLVTIPLTASAFTGQLIFLVPLVKMLNANNMILLLQKSVINDFRAIGHAFRSNFVLTS